MIDDDPIAAALSFIHDISPVNHRFKHGWTALHLSAAKGSVAEVKELLASRANFDLHDDDGETPVHLAAQYGHTDVIKMLVLVGADVDSQDLLGQTPLHKAVMFTQLTAVTTLLSLGCRASPSDFSGTTPLDLTKQLECDKTTKENMKKLIRAAMNIEAQCGVPITRKARSQPLSQCLIADGDYSQSVTMSQRAPPTDPNNAKGAQIHQDNKENDRVVQASKLVIEQPSQAALVITQAYALRHHLDFSDAIPDGFYDLGRDSDTDVWGPGELTRLIMSPVGDASQVREVILVDRRVDVKLKEYIDQACATLSNIRDKSEMLKALSTNVCDHFGGISENIEQSSETEIKSLMSKMQSIVLPLGVLKYGVCRHRAMCVKLIADKLGIPCTLTRGIYAEAHRREGHAWNVLDLDAHYVIIDSMMFSGDVIDICKNGEIAQRYIPECSTLPMCRQADVGTGNDDGRCKKRMRQLETDERPGPPVPVYTEAMMKGCMQDVINYEYRDKRHILHISEDLLVPLNSIDIHRHKPMLGKGVFAKVLEGSYGEESIAIKKFNGEKITARLVKNLVSEVRVLKDTRHPRIVDFYGIVYDCTNDELFLGIVLERMDASLSDVVHNYSIQLALDVALQLMIVRELRTSDHIQDMCSGMSELHRRGIIHRDLKTENILVNEDKVSENNAPGSSFDAERKAPALEYSMRRKVYTTKSHETARCPSSSSSHPRYRAKVSDFGLACLKESHEGCVGTPAYMSPEQLQGDCDNAVGCPSDVYAFGVIMWEIMNRKKPWEALTWQDIMRRVCEKRECLPEMNKITAPRMLEMDQDLRGTLTNTIKTCLAFDPQSRPNFDSLLVKLKDIKESLE